MIINNTLKEKNISIYRLSKQSGVPYATLNDICNGRVQLEKCSAETIYRIAKALDLSMEEIIAPCLLKRSTFENFKSTICHRVKEMGDIDFIIDTIENHEIRIYFEKKWYPESLYLLAMLDYISRINGIPLDNEYDDLRQSKLEKAIYPASLKAAYAASGDETILTEAKNKSIPEFSRFGIIENEVRNVV